MLAAVVVGIVLGTLWPGFLRRPSEAGAEEDEESYYGQSQVVRSLRASVRILGRRLESRSKTKGEHRTVVH
jgi:hypothetical protein